MSNRTMHMGPMSSEQHRMRLHIDNINRESDYDSEYANHPPPTDSEIEIEIGSRPLRTSGNGFNNSSLINEPLPEYLTDDITIGSSRLIPNHSVTNGLINRMSNKSFNRISNNNDINNSNNNNTNNNNDSIINNYESYLHNNSSTSLMNDHINEDNSNNNHSKNLLFGLGSTAMEDLYIQRNRLKNYGLKRLNVRQHILVTICRDIPIYSILKNYIVVLSQWYKLIKNPYNNVITVRATEFFLASLWCLVSALLSYTILDGLMVRWMVVYDIQAVIIRILSMSLIIIMIIEIFNYTFNNIDNEFCLTVWILISCFLTLIFIIQCFVSNNLLIEEKSKKKDFSNIDSQNSSTSNNNNNNYMGNYENSNQSQILERNGSVSSTNINLTLMNSNKSNSGITDNNGNLKKFTRKVDYYNLIVFAVVPIGVASFVSTVGLVRLLLILRLDVGMEMSRIQQGV